MLNSEALIKYNRANALVRFFMALITATTTIDSYKGWNSETLSALLLVAVFIDSLTNGTMKKHFEKCKGYIGTFLLLDVILCIVIALVSALTTPSVYLVATMTIWSFAGAALTTVWEDIKERSGNGRVMESTSREYSANGRICGLITAMVLGYFEMTPNFNTCMIILGLSTWFENYYMWILSKE